MTTFTFSTETTFSQVNPGLNLSKTNTKGVIVVDIVGP